MNTQKLLEKLITQKDLTTKESEVLLEQMMEGEVTPVQIGAILTALRIKGETTDELLGFVRVMRRHMVTIKTSGVVIDTCGTGGDDTGTFNISTAVALVVAGAGVKVAKHGNRRASSQSGSADVLEALGVHIDLSPDQAKKLLEQIGMTFLFAPLFHPAMKRVAEVRRELKIRTVFNFLGPLVNPASIKRQIIGVPSIEIAKRLAEVARQLDYDYLLFVSGKDGLDEITTTTTTHCFEVRKKRVREYTLRPRDFDIKTTKMVHLAGSNPSDNARVILDVLSGKKGSKTDIVLVNSAAALIVAGKANDLKEGMKLAEESIVSGKALEVLRQLQKESNL